MSVTYYYLTPSAPEGGAKTLSDEQLRIALALNAGSTAEELVDILFDTLDHLIPYERIGIAMRLDGELELRYMRSQRPVVWGKGSKSTLQGSSLAPIVNERVIRVINDLEAYQRDHPGSKTASHLLAEGMRSSLTLPLISRQRAIGVIFFSSTRTNAYGPEHVDFLRSLAAGIGVALERAELSDDLRHANAQLRTLDQLKNDFLSNLSHELRTPLNQVLSYSYALEDEITGSLTLSQHQYIHEVITGADRLNRLLGDLFDFTALEAGSFVLNRTETNLAALAREVAEDQQSAMVQAGLTFEAPLPDGPLMASVDPPALARALGHLLDNARKFTPAPGTVRLSGGQDPDTVWLEVSDTGIGIAPEFQDKVFERFFQVEHGTTRRFGGAGLGLALSKAIVEAHGGAITLVSEPAKGSTFRISLPRSS